MATNVTCRYCCPGTSSSLSRFHRQSLPRAKSSACSLCRLIASAVHSFCSNRAFQTPNAVDCWYPNTGDIIIHADNRQVSLQLCLADSSRDQPLGFDWCHVSQPSGDTGSELAVAWAREKLAQCVDEHQICRGPKLPLASRVLEIEPLPGKTQSPGAHGPLSIKLVETKSIQGDYACVSHCWGTSGPLKTTKATYSRFLSSIPWDELPKSFQEASSFAHQLGVRYLWIDSLCIIQDDPDDLKPEIANMCRICEGALVTLAVTKSHMSSEGCFSTLPPESAGYSVPKPENSNWPDVLVREAFDHAFSVHGYENPPQEKAPLLSRGWVLQERILSRRMLHFTREELAFECATSRCCECGRDSHDMPGFKATMTQEVQTDSRDALYSKWRMLVERYTTMNLTFESDRLPAISGLATKFESRLQDTFTASGRAICFRGSTGSPLSRYKESKNQNERAECEASLVDIKTRPELRPFTSASHFLRLEAPTVRTKITKFTPTMYKNPYHGQQYTLVDGERSLGDAIFPDFHLFDGPHGLDQDAWFYCALVVSFSEVVRGVSEAHLWFMILHCLDEKAGVYERIGWFEMTLPYAAWEPELVDLGLYVV